MFAPGTGSGAMQPLATSTRVQVLQSELLIAMTEISDAGNYTCNVSNTIGVATASAYLKVTRTSSHSAVMLFSRSVAQLCRSVIVSFGHHIIRSFYYSVVMPFSCPGLHV